MSLRNVVIEGDPILRKKSRPIEEITPRILKLLDDMADTMYYENRGIGIAAPQVGVLRRAFVVDVGDEHGKIEFINPEITYREGSQIFCEGCLSVPDLRGYVPRREGAVISYTDPETLTRVSETVRDFTAIIFQHECDHLDGILYTDRADSVFFSERSAAERMYYDSLGYYVKPSVLIR